MVAANDQIPEVLNASASFSQEADASARNNEAPNAAEQHDASIGITTGDMDLRRKVGDLSICWYYTKPAGVIYGEIFLAASLLCATFMQFCVIWVQWWSDASAAG
ncbi:hypothetical protein VB005_01508 [Metarhizium brunneum]